MKRAFSASVLALAACGATEEAPPTGLPRGVPFTLNRADIGDPLAPADVDTFTRKLTGFWRQTDFFSWILRVSHGVDASTGKPDFSVWWHDVDAIKQGDLVTFRHGESGGAHNIYIPTSRLLTSAAAGFSASKAPMFGRIVDQYGKGLSAACRGMVHGADDPNKFLMARNVIAQNHEFRTDQGKRAAVDYSGWYSAYEAWNAHRFEYQANPFWGDVWVTNMRSKDDVPHIYLADIFLRYALEKETVEGGVLGDECVRGFAKDIVDSGWKIRTKDKDGQPYVPEEDLASFVQYESIAPNGECSAKITSALLGTGNTASNDCGLIYGNGYEGFAVGVHYYNYHIVQTFHVDAILSALMSGQNEAARGMANGMMLRLDAYEDPRTTEPGADNSRWNADLAQLLLLAGAAGVPLTSAEARRIQQEYGAAVDTYSAWPRWDLWSAPDGTYSPRDGYLPHHQDRLIEIDAMAFALIYCGSPFKSPASHDPVDCAQILDPTRW